MTTIYLIRHGEAEGNVFRRFHGQYDSLLTPRGHRQVELVRKRFENIPIDACYASDLTRTSLTARSVYQAKGLPLRRDPRFREIGIGVWEDLPYAYLDVHDEKRMWEFNHDPTVWHVEGAECFEEYTQRFIDGMTDAAEKWDGGSVAIFAHGAVIRCTLMRLFFWNRLEELPYSDNTGVCKLMFDKGEFTYEFLNDNSHIPEELSTYYIQRWWRSTNNRKEAAVYFRNTDTLERPAILVDRPIGCVRLGGVEGAVGQVLALELDSAFAGRYYGDQLLGEAISHFRKLGCREIRLMGDTNPDDIVTRYGMDPVLRTYSIDTHHFDWGK